jgi:hypothetical protein
MQPSAFELVINLQTAELLGIVDDDKSVREAFTIGAVGNSGIPEPKVTINETCLSCSRAVGQFAPRK